MMAREGAVVVAVDFRNSIVASASGEVGEFPAGLDDCVSAVGGSIPTPSRSASTRTAS